MAGGTTFHFVTDGIEAALERARAAAGGADVSIAGGASTVDQALAAGLVDELTLHLAPVLLHAGERLFDGGRRRTRSSRPRPSTHRPRRTCAIDVR